jgi:DNA-binding transcriptional LysR family regulator
MELRQLKYFLAVTEAESISGAAETLFITQPNLSRQMQSLEEEIGQQLFVRGSRKITLTETGLLLKKRAEEILSLYNKTQSELSSPQSTVSGDIYIGGGESYAIEIIAKAAKAVQESYPQVKFHFFSGDTMGVVEKLDKGLIDFGILIEPADLSKYDYLQLPQVDTWGVLMRKDSPLCQKECVTAQDLYNLPLILSQHSMCKSIISDWFEGGRKKPNVVATYNLLYNASLLVEEGIGYALGLDKIINTSGNSNLCFKPLYPTLQTHLDIAWKKYQVFPKSAQIFIEYLKKLIEEF